MTEEPRPYTLVAELTYRCPLRCVYCSNPRDFARHGDALRTDDWLRVFREAEALGVVQLNLTGGEPLLRDDLEPLVEGARTLDLYTNLITSGVPLTREPRRRLRGRMEVLFVTPDYYTDLPKACMDGWGRRFLVVTPDGLVLPCHAAHTLPGLSFDNARERPLAEIWQHSAGFQAFRGEAWMPEPCRSCERRTLDFGGCRCQAYHLPGDATATDPASSLAPAHALIEAARAQAQAPSTEVIYRTARATDGV